MYARHANNRCWDILVWTSKNCKSCFCLGASFLTVWLPNYGIGHLSASLFFPCFLPKDFCLTSATDNNSILLYLCIVCNWKMMIKPLVIICLISWMLKDNRKLVDCRGTVHTVPADHLETHDSKLCIRITLSYLSWACRPSVCCRWPRVQVASGTSRWTLCSVARWSGRRWRRPPAAHSSIRPAATTT